MMPDEITEKLSALGLSSMQIGTLLMQPLFVHVVMSCLDTPEDAKRIANWLIGPVQEKLSKGEWTEDALNLDADSLIKLSGMVGTNTLSSSAAKEVLLEIVEHGGDPEAVADAKNLLQVSDTSELEAIVANVLKTNEKAAQDVRNGEMKAIGFLVGQVMKASQGKANPGAVQEIIKQQLSQPE